VRSIALALHCNDSLFPLWDPYRNSCLKRVKLFSSLVRNSGNGKRYDLFIDDEPGASSS
jgi:hypothetical protein